MAITINGTGTVTGVSVGGLPDGIVDADMLAADAVTQTKIGTKTFTSYAIIADIKSSNGDGGSATSGDWRTRDLNTEISDADGIVSISSNQFTLDAGTYLIEWDSPAYSCMAHQSRLYNVTTSSNLQHGKAAYSNSNNGNVQSDSHGFFRITITGSTVFEIQHRVYDTNNTYGFGVGTSGGMNWGGSASTDGAIWTVVRIYKEA